MADLKKDLQTVAKELKTLSGKIEKISKQAAKLSASAKPKKRARVNPYNIANE